MKICIPLAVLHCSLLCGAFLVPLIVGAVASASREEVGSGVLMAFSLYFRRLELEVGAPFPASTIFAASLWGDMLGAKGVHLELLLALLLAVNTTLIVVSSSWIACAAARRSVRIRRLSVSLLLVHSVVLLLRGLLLQKITLNFSEATCTWAWHTVVRHPPMTLCTTEQSLATVLGSASGAAWLGACAVKISWDLQFDDGSPEASLVSQGEGTDGEPLEPSVEAL